MTGNLFNEALNAGKASRQGLWRPFRACPPDVVEAVERIVEHWRVKIEVPRSGRSARLALTQKRGTCVANYLLGRYGRVQYSEGELRDAITAYARFGGYRAEGKPPRWKPFTSTGVNRVGFIDDADLVEQWVNRGREERRAAEHRRLKAEEADSATDPARARSIAAAAELERLTRDEPERLAAIEREVMTRRSRGMLNMRPMPTAATDRRLRGWVLAELSQRVTAGQVAAAMMDPRSRKEALPHGRRSHQDAE